MIEFIVFAAIAFFAAVIFIFVLRKMIYAAVVTAVFLIAFIVVGTMFFPENPLFQKGKDYILEKGGIIVEKGKDVLTAFVVLDKGINIEKREQNATALIVKEVP